MNGCDHKNVSERGESWNRYDWCKECGAINDSDNWELPRSSIPMVIKSDQNKATVITIPYCLPMLGCFRFDANLFAKYRNVGFDDEMSDTYVLVYFGPNPDGKE